MPAPSPADFLSSLQNPPKPRIFTARTLRSSRQVMISCFPLRSLRLRGENAFILLFRVIPCSSVANASSLLGRSPRIFTAKTRRPLRSSRQVCISCFTLRPLRLRGENAFMLHFRVIPCSSVANASSLLTVAHASGSDFPCSSVANAFFASLLFRVHPWQMLLFAYRR